MRKTMNESQATTLLHLTNNFNVGGKAVDEKLGVLQQGHRFSSGSRCRTPQSSEYSEAHSGSAQYRIRLLAKEIPGHCPSIMLSQSHDGR
jgi:hypothetical protein